MSLNKVIGYLNGANIVLDNQVIQALKNVSELAKERVWMAEGRPREYEDGRFDDFMDSEDLDKALMSVKIINSLLNKIDHVTKKAETPQET